MKKTHTAFFCQMCGHEEGKWFGRCPSCNEWNSMVEEKSPGFSTTKIRESHDRPQSIIEVSGSRCERIVTGIDELDRVLGGGLVQASVSLVGGEPGSGKSTLLQMVSASLAKKGAKVLYVSGEESKEQIRLNAERLGSLNENLYLLCETNIDIALKEALMLAPSFMVIDSVQTLRSPDMQSGTGSVAQIREICARVVNFAKSQNVATFLVGHVSKDGNIAGPKLLEHMVDTVLYFEQSRSDQYRLLRSHKNRFGSTNEIGLFEMSNKGLNGISNASAYFLQERPKDKPGSAVFCAIEGSRPLLVEIQALAVETFFGNPRRTCVGVDATRASVIAAVLEKHAKLMLSRMDLFISVAGGIDIDEPALDLALALAISSSVKNIPLPLDLIAFGELGLSGEIRSVHRIGDRLKEAKRLGFQKALVPESIIAQIGKEDYGLKIRGAKAIDEALDLLLRK